MKTKRKTLLSIKYALLVAAVLLLTACNTNSKEESEQSHTESSIQLNNGEKWAVNPEMKPHIESAQETMAEYRATNDTDYQRLAQRLKDQNGALIQSCTMKGESHDELHKWLHPHMGLIEELSSATSDQEAEATIQKLEASFKTYEAYFK